jgi:hypothetical protein
VNATRGAVARTLADAAYFREAGRLALARELVRVAGQAELKPLP